MLPKDFGIEVCANSFASAVAAEKGGAMRVELCDNLAEGGTTPSYAQIKMCVDHLHIEVWPILRPRGGDFLYTADEFEIMKMDLEVCKNLGCSGVVTGILTAEGTVDKVRCAELIKLASPMPVAFHRAFDLCNNLQEALEDLIELGFVRILTSGTAPTALAGVDIIADLIKKSENRICIMPGAGINPDNIKQIQKLTHAKNFHSTAKSKIPSKMKFKNPVAKLGQHSEEYVHEESSAFVVKQLVDLIK
ncbi:MAG: copper homeostasis protein CutC [Pedobacter sp.]|nr:MAG: copper homeostasis protein CutC [Pedobacter sp.]